MEDSVILRIESKIGSEDVSSGEALGSEDAESSKWLSIKTFSILCFLIISEMTTKSWTYFLFRSTNSEQFAESDLSNVVTKQVIDPNSMQITSTAIL